MKYQIFGFLLICSHFSAQLRAQEAHLPIKVQPLNIPLFSSGGFGEPRSNHFHSGTDLRTEAKEGFPVFAVDRGYVSRIKVSATGFGLALYITHPTGYTTVYAHLQAYNDTIAQWVNQQQYAKESFEVDLYLKPTDLPIQAGQRIGFSGNSGSSQGPHLHFELRNTATEEIYNPQEFGLAVQDANGPYLLAMWLYPLDENSFVDGKQNKVRIALKKLGEGSFAAAQPIPPVWGSIGLALEAIDQDDARNNNNGLQAWSLFLAQDRIFHARISHFAFDETRYVNATVDYEEQWYRKRAVYRLFKLPGNGFSRLKGPQPGLPNIQKDSSLIVGVVGVDAAGLTGAVEFDLLYRTPLQAARNPKAPGALLSWKKAHTLTLPQAKLNIPEKALYQDQNMVFQQTGISPLGLPEITLGPEAVAFHKPATLTAFPTFENAWKDKTVALVERNGRKAYHNVKWSKDGVKLILREAGKITWGLDTTAPEIKLIPPPPDAVPGTCILKIKDGQSGIESYEARIDNQWVLMEYDAKSGLLTTRDLYRYGPGPLQLVVQVADRTGNQNQAVFDFP
jgi:hypothetical protein